LVSRDIRAYTELVRRPLDRSVVLESAYELARREGIDAPGIRSVASDLGTTPMALYRYVADVEDLHCAVLDLVLASSPLTPTRYDEIRPWADTFRAWLAEVPGLSRLALLRWFELPPLLDCVEALLRCFADEGFEGSELVVAANATFTYVLARGEIEEAVREKGVQRSLPTAWPGDRPLLASLRDEYDVAQLDRHFARGLELLLLGLTVARSPEGL
jgi:AcrR family transcriptional regulator